MSGPGLGVVTAIEPTAAALRIAEATDGWVDVDGDIARPYGRAPIIGLDDYFNQHGRCVFVDGGYFLDPAAMAAWLRHPDFSVVK
ncbi:hypothetical protein AB0H43_04585 [Hamadaea sp. NPDC050747]|uniref:hypothetical protein n=1 Tax=Hamadaea sp. NPDC050747 TaxID=3155789 RepID=UPI0033D0104C